ncbi:hypothetical protein K7X08_004474 [Anisodus acutangulus]|uniref:RING-type domain-containing protein n=1 Tax=Anisodus acutangulus TaxID=402998 RepID=A0A9Q1MDV2_9SOLA|nr:hypothetical protein K7X08_004474 [Anisodus acutangulus]
MSTQDRRAHPIGYTRNHSRRKAVLDLDLNVAPPSDKEGTSSIVVPPAPIDDDVMIISSPRAIAQAKNSFMRTHGHVILVDEDSDWSDWLLIIAEDRFLKSNSRGKRRRVSTNQSTLIGDIYINLEANISLKAVTAQSAIPPKPVEATFSCPVCMGTLVEEMSTKCGHIFCKACIKASIAAQGVGHHFIWPMEELLVEAACCVRIQEQSNQVRHGSGSPESSGPGFLGLYSGPPNPGPSFLPVDAEEAEDEKQPSLQLLGVLDADADRFLEI